jgi:hypothetical protein
MVTLRALLSLSWCLSLGAPPAPALAQDLPAGLTWRNPPETDLVTPLPTEKFIILAREKRSDRAWDHAAGVWEVDLRGEGAIVPRLRFEDGYKSPFRFVYDREFARPDLITVHFSGAGIPIGQRVRLYAIDYWTWQVDCLSSGDSLSDLLWTDEVVYFEHKEDWRHPADLRVLRLDTNRVEKPAVKFTLVRRLSADGDLYLVRPAGAKESEYAVFDAGQERIVATCLLPITAISTEDEIVFSEDFSRCAVHSVFDVRGVESTWPPTVQHASSRIRVFDLNTNEEKSLPFHLDVMEGSGLMYCYLSGPHLSFTADSDLLYVETPPLAAPVLAKRGSSPAQDVYLYGFEANESIPAPTPFDAASLERAHRRPRPAPAFLPDYLTPHLEEEHPDRHDVAHAFLKSHEIDFEIPTAYCDTTVAFSRDDKRFVLKMVNSGQDDVFFVGDLERNTLRAIPAPKKLARASLSILWVDRPEQRWRQVMGLTNRVAASPPGVPLRAP